MVRLRLLLLCLFCLSLTPVVALAQEPVKNPEAQKHYDAGLAYVDDPTGPKWEEALREFRAAFRASGQWKLQNNIGLCALNLERDEEAIEAYREYLARSGADLPADKRKQIEKDVAMLSASLARVTVEVEPAEATILDERRNSKGEVVANRYPVRGGKASLGIHPGHHQMTIEATGYVSGEWAFEAEPASKHKRQFRLESRQQAAPGVVARTPHTTQPPTHDRGAPPPSGRHTPTSVYVSLIATGVFAAAATTTGVITMSKAKEFDSETDPTKSDELAKSGRTFALLTDIGIGAAILSAGAAAYFYFSAPNEPPAQSAQRQVRLAPVAGPNAAGVTLVGSF